MHFKSGGLGLILFGFFEYDRTTHARFFLNHKGSFVREGG